MVKKKTTSLRYVSQLGNQYGRKCELELDSFLQVRLPSRVKEQFAARAKAEGMSLSDLVWTALEERCMTPLPAVAVHAQPAPAGYRLIRAEHIPKEGDLVWTGKKWMPHEEGLEALAGHPFASPIRY